MYRFEGGNCSYSIALFFNIRLHCLICPHVEKHSDASLLVEGIKWIAGRGEVLQGARTQE